MTKRNGATRQVVRVEGVFDLHAARAIEAALARSAPGEVLHLDFSPVREFHDFGIAVLAQALKNVPQARVRVAGLRQHQVRLLRYFGVDADRLRDPQRGR